MQRVVIGSGVGAAGAIVLAAAMVPLRSHLDVATTGLVLVIPVVAGVVIGGLNAGLVSVAAGFLVYDFVFIPPYYTLDVGSSQHWVVLAVYVVVMLLVASVVSGLESARSASRARELNARRLFAVSELLLSDRTVADLCRTIVDAVKDTFGFTGVALLVPSDGRLEVAAIAGKGIDEVSLARLRPEAGVPVALSTDHSGAPVQTLALVTPSGPVGLLALAGIPANPAVRELLPSLANHLALALERAQLHERVKRAELLEEIDRLRHSLVGAVSHDLRTPLASIKVASSTLLDPRATISQADTEELHALIDTQTDRLTRIVDNVLDMTRIQAGVLEPRRQPCSALDLVAESLSGFGTTFDDRHVDVEVSATLPLVDVDPLLVEQVLSNLLDNAERHAPPRSAVSVRAVQRGPAQVEISVSDSGRGVPREERQAVFDTFVRFDTGGRAGLGLAIAKAFVEAHGECIWVEDAPGGGARFVFTLPVAADGGSRP